MKMKNSPMSATKDPSEEVFKMNQFENTIKMAGIFHFELLQFIDSSSTELTIYEKRYRYSFTEDTSMQVMHFNSRLNEIIVDARKLFRLIVDARDCYDGFVYVVKSTRQQIELEKKYSSEFEKAILSISEKRDGFEMELII